MPHSAASDDPHARAETTSRKRYSRIRVLIISWQFHDFAELEHSLEFRTLCDYFQEYIGVDECEHWEIPDLAIFVKKQWTGKRRFDYQKEVQARLQEFKQKYQYDRNELLIVYYGGHGTKKRNKYGRSVLIWSAKSWGRQRLEWSSLQWDCLFQGHNDAVLVMDCCDAGVGVEGRPNPAGLSVHRRFRQFLSRHLPFLSSFPKDSAGHKERASERVKGSKPGGGALHVILAACSSSGITKEPGEGSFTHCWLHAGKFERAFTLQEWFDRTRQWATAQGLALPVYKSFGSHERKIWFEPAQCLSVKDDLRRALLQITRKWEERELPQARIDIEYPREDLESSE